MLIIGFVIKVSRLRSTFFYPYPPIVLKFRFSSTMLGKPSVQEIQPCKSSVGINAVQLSVSQSSEICRRVQSSQATKVTNMKVFAGLVLLVSTSVAFPQAKSGCGTNERGVARKPGDNWQEQCNRCRCLESGVPGCTKKFCGSIPGLCK